MYFAREFRWQGKFWEGVLKEFYLDYKFSFLWHIDKKQGSFGNFRNSNRQGRGRNPSDCRQIFPLRFHGNGGKGAAPDQENRLSRWGWYCRETSIAWNRNPRGITEKVGGLTMQESFSSFWGNVIHRLVRDSLMEVLMDWRYLGGGLPLFPWKWIGRRGNQDYWINNLQCMEPHPLNDYGKDGADEKYLIL